MDKRTVIALVLVAIVIIATPKLFPSATPRNRVLSDSAQTRVAPPAPGGDTVAPHVASGGGTSDSVAASRSVRNAERQDSGSAPNLSVVARPETTHVQSSTARYDFTSVGASPFAVQLLGYQALDKSGKTVSLTTDAAPLLEYRVLSSTDTVSLASVPFAVEHATSSAGNNQLLTYRATVKNRSIQIKYDIVPDSFVAHVEGTIGNDAGGVAATYVLVNLPNTIRSFEADSLDDQNHLAFAIKPHTRAAEGIPFRKLDPGERRVVSGPIEWAAAKTKYFIVGILAHEGDQSLAEVQTVGGPRTGRSATMATGTVVARLNNGTFRFDLYTGPQKAERLKALGRDFENSNPYGGWLQGVVQPFAALVLKVLLWMRATFQLSYGWILIIFGIAVRLILWPLNHGAMRTSLKMQRIQPELNEVQKKYKNDPQKLQSEMMRVYKEHDMSPFSTFAGCLPLLLPMPVLFALFFVFQNTIEFRGVPFLWLNDISLKDPYYIVPLLMGGSMFILSWVGMRNAPPNPQAKMMQYVFPVMMTFLFANFASGLNLYYAIQNFAAIPQQWIIANERGKAGGGTKPKKA